MLTIGRVAFPSGDAPSEWEVAADGSVKVAGDLRRGSVDELLAARAALIATGDNELDPVVPVVWDEEPSVSGFYRVTGVSVGTVPASMSARWLPWSATLEPVRVPRRPEVVSAITAQVRSNEHEIDTGAPFHAVPSSVEMWTWQPTGTAVNETRPTAPGPAVGDVLYRRVTAGVGPSIGRWVCPPEGWYAGGCHAETIVTDRWVPVVGRALLPQPWRISNGLVRVTLVEGGLESGRLRIQWWRPDVPDEEEEGEVDRWTPAQDFGIGLGDGFDVISWRSAEVVASSPQRVKIRANTVRSAGRLTMVITIRRGSRLVDCAVDTDVVPGHRVRILPAADVTVPSEEEETDPDWYATLTSPIEDGGEAHWVFMARDSFEIDGPNGVFLPEEELAPEWTFGISCWFDGADDDTGSVVQTALDWFTAQTEHVAVR